MLAERTDAVTALRVADGWGSDAMVTFRRDGQPCMKVVFAGNSPEGSGWIRDGLTQWAAAGAPGAASVSVNGRYTTLTSCSALGPTVTTPGVQSFRALMVATTRNNIEAMLVQHFGFDAARCAANAAMRDPAFEPILEAGIADPYSIPDGPTITAERTRVQELGVGCQRGAIGITR